MAAGEKKANQIRIQLDGAELPHPVFDRIAEVTVDQHAHLPAMFTIRLFDRDLVLLDEGPFDLAKAVQIFARGPQGGWLSLLEGEITALEPHFSQGMIAELVVRGYDRSHRLFREMKSAAYLNTKDSDLAEQIAEHARLDKDIETTTTPYEHIFQANQPDLTFLMQRARRIGYECFLQDGRLVFRRPSASRAATLTWGKDLLSFEPRLSVSEQVSEVIVRGWNPETQQPIVGRADRGRLYPHIGEAKDGAAWSQAFDSSRVVIVDQPVMDQAEADLLAAARLDEISGAFIEADGVALRRPDLRAGQVIKLEALGKRLSGEYLLTSTRHEYRPDDLKTYFSLRGVRSGLLADVLAEGASDQTWPGVVIAKVTNTEDPKHLGRVKIKFPWLTEEAESGWARLLGIGAGPQAGLFALPEVDDEVLVSFEHGDISRPIILGGLWNGKQKPPPEVDQAPSGKRPLIRTWRSRSGHRLTMYDTDERKIEIISAAGQEVTLDDRAKTVQIQNDSVKIKLTPQGLEIESSGKISIHAGGDLELKANGQVIVKGAQIQLN